jgi:hypothetical protein
MIFNQVLYPFLILILKYFSNSEPTVKITTTLASTKFTTMNALGPLDAIDAVVPILVGQEFDCFHNFQAAVYE